MVVFTAIYIIYFSVSSNIILLLFPFLVPLFIFLVFKPQWIAYLFLLSSVRFLGMIDVEVFLRLPGFFKFTDLVFLLMIGVYIFDAVKNGFYFPFKNQVHVTLAWIVFSFTLLVILQIVVTSLRFDLPFVSAIKVGRGYLYLLFY